MGDDARIKLIRRKNQAFDQLVRADRLCRRRRHTAGHVPPSWVAQLEELAREYEEWIMQLREQVRERLRAAGITTLRPSMDATDADWRAWLASFDASPRPDERAREVEVGACPRCGGELVRRKGRFGEFIGCSEYPRCKYTQSV